MSRSTVPADSQWRNRVLRAGLQAGTLDRSSVGMLILISACVYNDNKELTDTVTMERNMTERVRS